MEQLLQITTIPIKYELKVKNASLEYHNGTAEVEISRNSGGMQIKSRPIRVKLDTYEARNSVVPTTKTQIQRNAAEGKRAAYEATANFAREGRMLLKAKIGEGSEALGQILAQRTARPTGQFQLGFIPTTGPEIDWEGPELSIEYQMDKLNFDTKIQKGDIQFVPGDIELSISQYPDVQIEYIGKPIYVPPSAMERFEPQIDVQA
ncbi:MAG: hypothetical protein HFE84_03250 [Lachnospiraceae bacterium]|nr:hypothetical protein [Lachnospiraceae bacterium]